MQSIYFINFDLTIIKIILLIIGILNIFLQNIFIILKDYNFALGAEILKQKIKSTGGQPALKSGEMEFIVISVLIISQ